MSRTGLSRSRSYTVPFTRRLRQLGYYDRELHIATCTSYRARRRFPKRGAWVFEQQIWDDIMTIESEDDALAEAIAAFEREVGVTGIPYVRVPAGNREFLKFVVGREAPVYTHALRNGQKSLGDDNPFRGAMGLAPAKPSSFPASIEANALLTLLTRSTREVSQDRSSSKGYEVPYVPFQKREDHQLAQPASHIVRGRRGVGKSTLIRQLRFARRRCRSRRCAGHAARTRRCAATISTRRF